MTCYRCVVLVKHVSFIDAQTYQDTPHINVWPHYPSIATDIPSIVTQIPSIATHTPNTINASDITKDAACSVQATCS